VTSSRKPTAGFWISLAIVSLAILLSLYPFSYPWADVVYIRATIDAVNRREDLPEWMEYGVCEFYMPLRWGIRVMPERVLESFQSYHNWCMKLAGINLNRLPSGWHD
jgi:hypothetical protein